MFIVYVCLPLLLWVLYVCYIELFVLNASFAFRWCFVLIVGFAFYGDFRLRLLVGGDLDLPWFGVYALIGGLGWKILVILFLLVHVIAYLWFKLCVCLVCYEFAVLWYFGWCVVLV